ncbi:hypothetical protein WG622_12745 [Cognatishimia sp. D5M38]|uniref:Uncharacterized protein n=1 Tax=Cognatishimia coralii TaxID=3083254 RepID=A0ABU8QI64_9RHOB
MTTSNVREDSIVKLIGSWRTVDGSIQRDETEEQIEEMLSDCLETESYEDDGWAIILRNGKDGSKWRLTYVDTSTHGGGPRILEKMDD